MGWGMEESLKGEGTRVYLWLIHVVVWQKPTQHCKAIILQLKIIKYSYPLSHQGSQVCCSPWGCKKSDVTEQPNWTEQQQNLTQMDRSLWFILTDPVFFLSPTHFIFKILFIFNWRIIALQYHVGFCHTTTWISHRYTYVPSLLSLPPTSLPIPCL